MHIIQGPSLLILTFYGLVMFQLWCSAPVRPTRSASHQRLQRRVTRLILTVITVYIICWLPHWVIQIVLLLSPPDTMSDLLMVMILLSSCLQYANSGIAVWILRERQKGINCNPSHQPSTLRLPLGPLQEKFPLRVSVVRVRRREEPLPLPARPHLHHQEDQERPGLHCCGPGGDQDQGGPLHSLELCVQVTRHHEAQPAGHHGGQRTPGSSPALLT